METYITCHARFDRTERLVAMLAYIGLGEHKYQFTDCRHPDNTLVLTSTGLLLIYDKAMTTLITGYVPKVNKVAALSAENGIRIDDLTFKAVKRNVVKYRWIAEM